MSVRSRSLFVSVVVLGVYTAACGPARPGQTGGGAGGSGGSATGGGSAAGGGAGGGTGGGSATGGGAGGGGGTGGTDGGSTFSYDGGTTINAAKGAPFCSEKVTVNNVVITAVSNSFAGSQGDYSAQFWVADPNNLKDALYVDKFFTDPSVPPKVDYKPGMIVNLQGYMFRQSNFVDRVARRLTIKSQFNCRKPDNTFYNPADSITVTLVDAGTGAPPAPLTAPAGFGDAMMGNGRPNPDYGSVRVKIPGPLTLTQVSPPAFKRVSLITTDTTYFGFEVTGGVLVNNFNTFDRTESDGGVTVRCDYRKMLLAADGGSVTFPNGITGVWDTYAHASCEDGGTSCSGTNDRRNNATVPGATPPNDYTYVLYPVDCTELPGVFDAGL